MSVPTTASKTRWYSTGGPWGTGLLLLGLALIIQGLGYLFAQPGDLRSALAWINQGVPVSGWALLWITAGGYSVFQALTPPQRHVDMAPAVGIICVWSAIYGIYWATLGITEGVWTRDWTACVAWLGLACVLISFGRCVNPPQRIER